MSIRYKPIRTLQNIQTSMSLLLKRGSYYRRMLLCAVAVNAVIVLLVVLLLHSGPRVRLFKVDTNARLTTDAVMTITFDRPLDMRDYTSSVSIEPRVDFTSRVQGKSLLVTLKGNLQQASRYTVKISPDIYDANGNRMRVGYTHTFNTNYAQFVYLQRHYEAKLGDGSKEPDEVLRGDLSGTHEQIFTANRIRLLAANSIYAVVAVDEEDSDAIYTVNLQTKMVRKEVLYINGTVLELALSPQGTIALYTIQPDYNPDNPESFEKFAYQLHALDLTNGQEYLLQGEDRIPIRAETITFNNDGQYALIKSISGAFMVVSPFNDYDPVLLGAHTRTFGFDSRNEYIVFEDEGELSTYRLADAVKEDRPTNKIVLGVSADKGGIFMHTADYESTRFVSRIYQQNSWEDERKVVWESADQSLIVRNFALSYDQRYIALQRMTSDCKYDDYETASECSESTMVLYDTLENKIVDSFGGLDFVWLP